MSTWKKGLFNQLDTDQVKNMNPMYLMRLKYRTRAKISRAYSKLTRFLDALIFDPCLFSGHDDLKYL